MNVNVIKLILVIFICSCNNSPKKALRIEGFTDSIDHRTKAEFLIYNYDHDESEVLEFMRTKMCTVLKEKEILYNRFAIVMYNSPSNANLESDIELSHILFGGFYETKNPNILSVTIGDHSKDQLKKVELNLNCKR